MIRFDWDPRKAEANKRVHKVSFEEAISVFYDSNAVQYFDPDHSENEDRFIMLGLSHNLRMLVVCHCHREDEDVIRIISARKATKKEAQAYPYRR